VLGQPAIERPEKGAAAALEVSHVLPSRMIGMSASSPSSPGRSQRRPVQPAVRQNLAAASLFQPA
jgi:hypothetical protein